MVQDLDLLSDLLCRVIDVCDFVRATHPNSKFVDAATECYQRVYEYMNVLNTTTGLHTSLSRALADPAIYAEFSDEEKTVAKILMIDFEKSGINLPDKARKRFVELSNDIAELGTHFVNGMRPETKVMSFPSSRLRGMDAMVVQQLTRRGKVSLPMVGMPVAHALRTVHDPEVRRDLYLAHRTSAKKQLDLLEALLTSRAELAKLVEAESYADMTLATKMAGSPKAVNQFLDSIGTANAPALAAETAQLEAIKGGALEPWDKDYYSTRLLASKRSLQKNSDLLSHYFSLGRVIQGLSRLFTSLYGLRFVPVPPSPGETWDPAVRRLDVHSDAAPASSPRIAVIYFDLFARPGKNPNPAHFTLRCSRRISTEEEASCPPQYPPHDGMPSTRDASGTLHQLPTVTLICDFPHPTHNTPPLLSLRDLQTLFHEMGHALHSILGRTALHNVAGTRCATDFAELPSVLMEHFAGSEQVLGLFARHYQTDTALPYGLVAERLKRDALLAASDTAQQVLLSRLDQRLHCLTADRPANAVQVWQELAGENTSWLGFFGHLYGYGGTYYSYLFDRAIAARVWREVFKGKELEREGGERWARECLRWGGARNGWECVAGALGQEELREGGERAMGVVGRWGGELKETV